MTSWDITIELPPDEVIRALRALPDASVLDIPTGIGIEFGDGRAAWVDSEPFPGDPDDVTDICIKDYSTLGAWQIYARLEEQTAAPMSMTDFGGILVRERRWTPFPPEYASRPEDRRLHTWDSRAVGAQVLEQVRASALSPADALEVVRASKPLPWQLLDRTSDLVASLVDAGLLTPTPIYLPEPPDLPAWDSPDRWTLRQTVSQAHRFFPREGEPPAPGGARFASGPVLTMHGDAPISRSDVTEWLLPEVG
ncbi:hypothetical protein ASH01_10590 [Terrabacter sp. Soil811]|uniref:hypothetical protein n=1 Tax=Terrabacter sp. Soil811 TaxID=1736419 RepID=UPI0007017C87|nr:hypothetical protein [Terrabacter sp. Soil811]KRF44457.1 hypothetical protein ASH01_10590 [Terrabacter sp. Soil811]